MRSCLPSLLLLYLFSAHPAVAQQNRIDVVTPFAPELASYGKYAVGVRAIRVTDKNRPDVLSTPPGGPTARSDRTLTIEVWYPATLPAGQAAGGEYRTITRDPSVPTTLRGQAVRDAAPLTTAGAFPLVIVSHGYPGNRYLLGHLGENLASKGFVVVAIDHKDGHVTTTCRPLRARCTTDRWISCSCWTKSHDWRAPDRAASSPGSSMRIAPASSAIRWVATGC